MGTPSAPSLSSAVPISYPITVQSVNAESGSVNLSLAPASGAMPTGVGWQFSPAQVSLSSEGSATTTLTFNSTTSTPGGTYPLVVTGTLGSLSRTATFSLATQVTTFTGSVIVHNDGQGVPSTLNVPSGSAPSYTTCTCTDPAVTCAVSSTPTTVTLTVTASASAVHGTRVLSLNPGAATVQVAIADEIPQLQLNSIGPNPAPVGSQISLYGSGFSATCDGNPFGSGFDCYDTSVVAQNDQYGADLDIDSLSDGLITATVNLPPGDYSVWVNACTGNFDPEASGPSCDSNELDFVVEAPPPPTCTLKFQYRGLDFPLLGLVIGHSYLHFTNSSAGIDEVIEGYTTDPISQLLAQEDDHGLTADDKANDKSAGSVSGAFVCDWLTPIRAAVSAINGAHITYAYTGPNSNSAARYMLAQTPTTFTPWWQYPGGLVGFYTLLPGLEH
ncbi:hypothetical protein SBA4_6570003 [Candidatus Sulfopaludibacter sp. SbA4]|nr:hypothetical protein SBA4_6570003 [Candidatus Sulfopaludibacter sp. SbA4]